MFFDMPELKFHDLGPIPVKQEGETYRGADCPFRVTEDKRLLGTWSFDGNRPTFEREPWTPGISAHRKARWQNCQTGVVL